MFDYTIPPGLILALLAAAIVGLTVAVGRWHR